MARKLFYGEAPGDRRNVALLMLSMLLWAISLTSANFLLKHNLLPDGPIALIAAAALSAIVIARRYR